MNNYKVLVYNPKSGVAYGHVKDDELEKYNLLEVGRIHLLGIQYDALRTELERQSVEVIDLAMILEGDEEFEAEKDTNPNLVYMRDSTITMPWMPRRFITANMKLESRSNEPQLIRRALQKLGFEELMSFDGQDYIEGGDVIPTYIDGERTVLVGIGNRTTESAVEKLASKLLPKDIDRIIAINHDSETLHLDVGFAILPKKVIYTIKENLTDGYVLDKNGKIEIKVEKYFKDLGYKFIFVDKAEAVKNQLCNLASISNVEYVSFKIPPATASAVEKEAGIKLIQIEGSEIAKGFGGVRCSTRPLFY